MILRAVMVIALVLLALAPAAAQNQRAASPKADSLQLEPIKGLLDEIERAIHGGGQTDETLKQLRDRLAPVREGIRAQLEVLDPRLAEVTDRLNQLGPAPDAATENKELAAERERLAQTRADVDAAVKQTRLLATRADDISGRINEQRRTLFARALFAHTVGVFDLAFWRETVTAGQSELYRIGELVRNAVAYAKANGGESGLIVASLTVLAFGFGALLLGRWLWRRIRTVDLRSRFSRAIAALSGLAARTVAMPLAVLIVLRALQGNGLMAPDLDALGSGLVVAVLIASFGRGVAIAVLAPANPRRRLFAVADAVAARLTSHFTWCARALGLSIFVNVLLRETAAPLTLTVASSALVAIVIAAIVLHLVVRPPPADAETPGAWDDFSRNVQIPWLRTLGWILLTVTAVALVTGYIGFAAFLVSRFLVLMAMLGAFYVTSVFVDTLFEDVLAGSTPLGRRIAAMIGLTPRAITLIGTLVAGLVKIALALLALIPVIGPWGVIAADFFSVLEDAMFGFKIGDITISFGAVFTALIILLVGVLATRLVQRWLDTRFLPQTKLDPGLQNSVSALVGYSGIIAVLVLMLAELGIDLQKIAIIAGALSVGIGFGLQSIVSNFVSGLILLAERPIRVGDWVVVKSDEGFVRRISVRATEIETFDRASVIIPNSEFVTGVVKNWTHANTMGRITVKVGVSYDADPELVKKVLLECATQNKSINTVPGPTVFLIAFGEKALEFELRCIVSDVHDALAVKSDLQFAILRHFREAGIAIPTNPAEMQVAPIKKTPAPPPHA